MTEQISVTIKENKWKQYKLLRMNLKKFHAHCSPISYLSGRTNRFYFHLISQSLYCRLAQHNTWKARCEAAADI